MDLHSKISLLLDDKVSPRLVDIIEAIACKKDNDMIELIMAWEPHLADREKNIILSKMESLAESYICREGIVLMGENHD